MARTGRPPKPLEQKRLTARSQTKDIAGRPLPSPAEVVALPMAPGVPDPPADLQLDGRRMWERAWAEAITWLSPHSDMEAVEHACRLVDDLAVARRRYRATTDPADARALATLQKLLAEALSTLGFDPTARSRLGLAEVKRASKLDELRARRTQGSN